MKTWFITGASRGFGAPDHGSGSRERFGRRDQRAIPRPLPTIPGYSSCRSMSQTKGRRATPLREPSKNSDASMFS